MVFIFNFKITHMKKILLPLFLICFTVITLGFIHIDNVNKLDKQYNDIEIKKQLDTRVDTQKSEMIMSDIK